VSEVLKDNVPSKNARTTMGEVAFAWLRHKEASGRVGDATLAQRCPRSDGVGRAASVRDGGLRTSNE
jgi:hypothetical protein